MERKLNKIANWFKKESNTIAVALFLFILTFLEITGIVIAILKHNYVLLTFSTYVWVMMITEVFIKKYFFKKLDYFLIKTPYTSNLIFFVVALITIILSWKYLIAFVLCVIQAMLYGEYCRLKSEKTSK